MAKKRKAIQAAAKEQRIIAISAPVEIAAAEGDAKGPAKFNVVAYTGQAMRLEGWDQPVVVEIDGMEFAETLTANLDHDATKRVGHVTEATKHDGKVLLAGVASAVSTASDEVVRSGSNGYPWKASIEADPLEVIEIPKGKSFQANGQTFNGPAYHVTASLLNGFGFVTRGADKGASASIAASAASHKERVMKAEVRTWAESMGIDVDSATPDLIATIEANYEGKNGKPAKKIEASNPFEARKIEAKRRNDIRDIADKFIERRDGDLDYIEAVEKMHDHAIDAKMTAQEFRNEMWEQSVPMAHTVPTPRRRNGETTGKVLEAALCQAGGLANIEKHFDAQTLDAAHTAFRDGIGLNQLIIVAAENRGYRGTSGGRVNRDILRAAFNDNKPIHAQGWSTIDISTIVSNTANKFLHEGWMAVDQVPLRLSTVKSVRDFKQITTVSLTGAMEFEELGPGGEIKHATAGELSYTNQAKTYAAMLAITRTDIINDDLGALTAVPRRLGRGGALKLADLFWSVFLGAEAAGHISSANGNFNELAADMTIAGLTASELLFMSQTDPDGKPLAIMPKIIVVPTALHAKALALMTSEKIKGDADEPDGNIWRGRFRVETSPYMHNTAYTGQSASEWYMMADPSDLPFIEIAALNGRVEPTVETADADFNTLGVQMRGYSDVGVAVQEYRAIVKNDGGTS